MNGNTGNGEGRHSPEWRPCDRCHGRNVKLRRKIASNGAEKFCWWCLDCERHANQHWYWIGHETVQKWYAAGRFNGKSIEDVPIVADYRDNVTCIVCGSNAAEYHHFAPQSLSEFFDKWAQWPGAYLCVKHHRQWHNIVTWYLPGRTDPELAGAVRDRFLKKGWAS